MSELFLVHIDVVGTTTYMLSEYLGSTVKKNFLIEKRVSAGSDTVIGYYVGSGNSDADWADRVNKTYEKPSEIQL